MLFRNDGDDVIAIAQPSHSWLSGQLLRVWGNGAFATPSPHEEVCLGAALHDIGWTAWETAPTLNPATGRPHEFREVGAAVHTALWADGVRLAGTFGRYPALLVSMHADTIYGRFFDVAKASPEDAALVRAFLDGQHAFQRASIAALAADPRLAAHVTPEAVDRNRRLVATVDWMSLAIGWGVVDEVRISGVPRTGTTLTEFRLRSPRRDPAYLTLDPWPAATDRVEVLCDGRRLRGRFTDATALREALDAAERLTIAATLVPG